MGHCVLRKNRKVPTTRRQPDSAALRRCASVPLCETETMINKTIIITWGWFDLCSFGWYLSSRLLQGQVPFYCDIVKSIKTNTSFGIPSLAILTVFSLLLYVTLVFSGYYLIRQKRIGAILSYIQTPFRLLTFIPPSIFFLPWPFKYIFSKLGATSSIVVFWVLVLISEGAKIASIVMWQRRCSSNNTRLDQSA